MQEPPSGIRGVSQSLVQIPKLVSQRSADESRTVSKTLPRAGLAISHQLYLGVFLAFGSHWRVGSNWWTGGMSMKPKKQSYMKLFTTTFSLSSSR